MTTRILTHPSPNAESDWRRHVTIATHSGSFHADDVAGTAILQLVFPNCAVIRTRDQALIDAADFAVDVGGKWEPSHGRFDHHQKGFTGARADGTVYASAGLVWAQYGSLCLEPWANQLNDANIARIVASMDAELMIHLDRADTGAAQGAPGLFGLSALVSQYNPTWLEENCLGPEGRERIKLERFNAAVHHVKTLLSLALQEKVAEVTAENIIRASELRFDGRVLVLGNGGMPWTNVVCNEMPGVLFVVYPDSTDDQYQIRTVPVEPQSFVARADLPAAWAGLRGEQLAEVTGVADAVFCHNACFIGGAGSLTGALKLAELALGQLASKDD